MPVQFVWGFEPKIGHKPQMNECSSLHYLAKLSKVCEQIPGFPTGVDNMGGGSSEFDGGGGLSQCMRGAWEAYKGVEKTCQGVYLLVKLLAISLQAGKFTKNELLHIYFLRILARF